MNNATRSPRHRPKSTSGVGQGVGPLVRRPVGPRPPRPRSRPSGRDSWWQSVVSISPAFTGDSLFPPSVGVPTGAVQPEALRCVQPPAPPDTSWGRALPRPDPGHHSPQPAARPPRPDGRAALARRAFEDRDGRPGSRGSTSRAKRPGLDLVEDAPHLGPGLLGDDPGPPGHVRRNSAVSEMENRMLAMPPS